MKNKKGISLIVLVITIIVMIILAASVVITLSNTGVIDRAGQAVELTNEKNVQNLAAVLWSEAYIDELRGEALINKVKEGLTKQGVTDTDWNIDITDKGVVVTSKNAVSTLGKLVTPANYGKTVDYSVTVDGTTYGVWQVYYEDESTGRIFLISRDVYKTANLEDDSELYNITEADKTAYNKFIVGSHTKYTLNTGYINTKIAVAMEKNYSAFAATTKSYKTYVEGAIGGPTIDMLVTAWNQASKIPTLTLTTGNCGYELNVSTITSDGFYIPTSQRYWLASPANGDSTYLFIAGQGQITNKMYDNESFAIRPVVCIKSDIPAKMGTTTDFSLVE